MTVPFRVRAGGALLAVALAATAGCATYVASSLEVRDDLRAGRWDSALEAVDAGRKGADRLLRLLLRGHVLHYAGRFEESNAVFQEAEDLSAELYTRSVSQAALSLIVNDTTVDYRGQPFELAMVPYYRAFNYLSLGDVESAQVEARKAVLRLARSVEVTLAELEGSEELSRVAPLADNGFLHWFSGLLFEADGAVNDAFVAYRNALSAYRAERDLTGVPPPGALARDLERVGRALGFTDELEALREEVPDLFREAVPGPVPRGEVVLLVETGWIAHRDQVMVHVPILDTDRRAGSPEALAGVLVNRAGPGWRASSTVSIDYWLTAAVPELAPPEPGVVRGVRLSAAGRSEDGYRVDDLSRRAQLFHKATLPRVLFKTFLRALAKYAVTRAAEKEDPAAGLLVNLLGVVTERADTRCWSTLPDGLRMARLPLPPGRHDLRIEYLDERGAVLTEETTEVTLRPDGWVFLNRRPL